MTGARHQRAPHVWLLDPAHRCPEDLNVRAALAPARSGVSPGEVEAVVILTDDPSLVRSTLALGVRAPVLVVATTMCAAGTVTALFDAGADACVRGRNAQEIEAHLLALLRRSDLGGDGARRLDHGSLMR